DEVDGGCFRGRLRGARIALPTSYALATPPRFGFREVRFRDGTVKWRHSRYVEIPGPSISRRRRDDSRGIARRPMDAYLALGTGLFARTLNQRGQVVDVVEA